MFASDKSVIKNRSIYIILRKGRPKPFHLQADPKHGTFYGSYVEQIHRLNEKISQNKTFVKLSYETNNMCCEVQVVLFYRRISSLVVTISS